MQNLAEYLSDIKHFQNKMKKQINKKGELLN